MIRHLTLAALALVLAAPPAPAAAADDELVRQLIDSCVGCRFPKDLHGRDLHGLRFVGADLRDVNFSHANLNGAQFTGANLAGARFDDADLRNAQFVGVEFRGTSFARAKVDGITMRDVRLGAGSIVGADYKRFLRDCGGCDVADSGYLRYPGPGMLVLPRIARIPRIAVMPPEVERSLRELERTMREHPPAMSPEVERQLRELERQLREHPPVIPRDLIERSVRWTQPAVPPLPTLPPLAPVPPAPAAPPAPPA